MIFDVIELQEIPSDIGVLSTVMDNDVVGDGLLGIA